MAQNKKPVSRAAKSTSQTIRIRLAQIKTDKEHDYCHRGADALKPDNLAGLADSLVAEGQQTPFTVYHAGRKDEGGAPVYVLIGGFRRYHALKKAIKQNLDSERIHDNMEVEAVEVVQGEEQEPGEFRKDILIRSVAENEQRKNFTTPEKLEIVKELKAAKVPDPRAASALAISETQYRRFVSVTDEPWLHTHVTDNCIGMSDSAELVQAAKKKNRVKEFEEDLDQWVKDHRVLIEQEREELAKVGKKLTGSAAHVKKYATTQLVKHWLTCIENGRRFDDNVGFKFGILVDTVKGSITIPSTQLKVTELSAEDFETMICELEDTVDRFLPLMRERKLVEEVTDMSDEDREKERERIRAIRRQRQQKAAKANAGRPADDFGQTDPPDPEPLDLNDEENESEATPADNDGIGSDATAVGEKE